MRFKLPSIGLINRPMATAKGMGWSGVAPRFPIIVSAKLMHSWTPTRPRRANPLPTPTGERPRPHPLKGGIGSGRPLATTPTGPLPRRGCNQWPPADVLRGLMPPAPPSFETPTLLMSEPARSIAYRPTGVRFADRRYSEQTSARAERGDRSNLFCRLCPAARGHRGRCPYPFPGVPMQQAYAYAIPPSPHPTPRPPRTPGEKIGRTFFVGYRFVRGKSTSLPRTPSL